GTLNFHDILRNPETLKVLAETPSYVAGLSVAALASLLLFAGTVGKSAQFPLHVWLPDAMEGPTPVSAMIHAATMVSAGVYTTIRMFPLLQAGQHGLGGETAFWVVALIGAFTAFMAATMGVAQNDIKRVLAYSTISQLGYMLAAVGIGAYVAAAFHLITHAFFKALLFLGSGAVIHALSGEQDIRRMGGLWSKLPITGKTFLAGALAIAGIFPLAGFFSKDEILWKAFTRGEDFFFKVLWGVGLITALMTAFYMFRLVFLTFFGKSRVPHEVEHHIHEAPKSMAVPLIVLALGSVVGGWVGWPAALGGGNWFEHFLHPVFASRVEAEAVEHSHALELGLMVVSLAVAGAGIWLAYQFYLKRTGLPDLVATKMGALYGLVYNKYYVDEIYSKVFVEGPILGKGMGTAFAAFDQKVIDGVGVDGSAWATRAVSRLSIWWDTWIVDGSVNLLGWMVWVLNLPARAVQTGLVQRYALWMAAGIVLLLFYYVERYWSLLFGS
ncbi:MAG TPA: NADH-quinone oxidoreductase subunit L, partial [Candidatus Xenobia bacterium]|nr:NADH-quinone oxidoreductase subunit L [Candidatus Xenobia bacterium]